VTSPSPATAFNAKTKATDLPLPDLVRIRELIYRAAGIFHPDNKLHLLMDRCQRRMKAVRVPDLHGYLSWLTTSPLRQSELMALLNEITIGETCFFRNEAQLNALRRIVIPSIIRAKSRAPSRCLRIWSAGCSTGEEPYTLRILLMEEAQTTLRDWVITVLATDINEPSLAHAREGFYDHYSTRKLTAAYREKYFLAKGEKLRLNPLARSNVIFRRLNLSDDIGMAEIKSMDVIFCGNVLIYFNLDSKRRVLRHFLNSLLPHGYLFLGQSESLYGVSEDFRLVHFPGTTAYMKAECSLCSGEGKAL
jgi:chemotaxis protein methyltransferase CheR